jgi:hypothetical protein
MMANRLISLAVLAMLAFAPIITPASAQNSALTPELLSRILDLNDTKGTDRDVPALVANGLGLSASGKAWPSRQVAVKDLITLVSHGVVVSRESDQDIIFNRRNSDNFHAFRTQRDGTLVTAVSYDLNTLRLTVLSRAEARQELDVEFAFWDRTIVKDK